MVGVVVWNAGEKNKANKENVPALGTSHQRNREWEVKLSELKNDHCRFTHEDLPKGYHVPYCQESIVPLTVKHVLTE